MTGSNLRIDMASGNYTELLSEWIVIKINA